MKIDEFIKSNIGKKVDYDGVYGAQCVDLFRKYSADVLEIPEHTGAVKGAKELVLNYERLPKEKKYFNCFRDCHTLFIGDVLVWNSTASNEYGHVAIYLGNVSKDSVIVFEQDGFTQDGAKLNIRSRKNLAGILRCK